jgi:hypothetical protein
MRGGWVEKKKGVDAIHKKGNFETPFLHKQ